VTLPRAGVLDNEVAKNKGSNRTDFSGCQSLSSFRLA
jgi:hypothetical protein